MAYYVLYDPITTQVTGRCDSLIADPPAGSTYIEVATSEEMMQTWPSGWCVVDNQLVPPPPPDPQQILDTAKANKRLSISKSCGTNIESGFKHTNATVMYHYPSKITDQLNINNAAQVGGSLWRMIGTTWEFVFHTPTLANEVKDSLWSHIQQCQTQLDTLYSEVENATTIEAVEAINWTTI